MRSRTKPVMTYRRCAQCHFRLSETWHGNGYGHSLPQRLNPQRLVKLQHRSLGSLPGPTAAITSLHDHGDPQLTTCIWSLGLGAADRLVSMTEMQPYIVHGLSGVRNIGPHRVCHHNLAICPPQVLQSVVRGENISPKINSLITASAI